MSIKVERMPLQYNGYKVDKIKQRIEKQKDSGSCYDRAKISTEGKKAFESRMSALAEQRGGDGIRRLSSISTYGYISDFEKALSDLGKGNVSGEYMTGNYSEEIAGIAGKFEMEKGEKTDSFDCHVNKMVSAYNMMRDKIEEKYSNPEHEVEYYVADNGEIEELTKEKELEMLDRAYANHSTFMATSTEIWAELQDFTPSVVYHKGGGQAENEQAINESQEKNTAKPEEKGKIKNMVYQAFISAIQPDNQKMSQQYSGDWKDLRLNLNVSSDDREMLNGIWDYYANKR